MSARNRNSNTQAKKRQFAELSTREALAAVRCGFELETHSVDGMDWDEWEDVHGDGDDEEEQPEYVIDQEAYDQERKQWLLSTLSRPGEFLETAYYLLQGYPHSNIFYSNEERGIGRLIFGRYSLHTRTALRKHLLETITGLLRGSPHLQGYLDRVEYYYRQYRGLSVDSIPPEDEAGDAHNVAILRSIPDGPFRPLEDTTVVSALRSWFDNYVPTPCFTTIVEPDETSPGGRTSNYLPEGIIAKEDGSVEGPELIVEGRGTTAAKFSQLLQELTGKHRLSVGLDCSFHIHLSIPGIKHSYGSLMQVHLMEYLLDARNLRRVPQSVLERWRADFDDVVHYFNPVVSTGKYSFVRFHENLGTWEFRCFGNVRTHRDGMQCLRLAVEALQYAYACSLELEQPILGSEHEWSPEYFYNVIHGEDSLRELVAAARRQQRRAA